MTPTQLIDARRRELVERLAQLTERLQYIEGEHPRADFITLRDEIAAVKAKLRRPPRELLTFRGVREDNLESVWIEGVHGERMVHGIASTGTISKHEQSFDPWGCVARLPVPLFSAHSKRSIRERKPIGEVHFLRKTRSQVYVQAILNDGRAADHAWDLILGGEVRSFSRGGPGELDSEVDGIRFYRSWTLSELSICRAPANPDCHFEILDRAARPGRASAKVAPDSPGNFIGARHAVIPFAACQR
jgi:hypothetical protein